MVDRISYIRGSVLLYGRYGGNVWQLTGSPGVGRTCLHLGHQLAPAPIQIDG